VLVLPGGWQASRQSAYSMATRCVEELHVFLDSETQQTGPYRETDPIQALAQRWARDAKKHAASTQLTGREEFGELAVSSLADDLVVTPSQRHEPAPAWMGELTLERDLGDGLAIDL
jgi:hypothetical protein